MGRDMSISQVIVIILCVLTIAICTLYTAKVTGLKEVVSLIPTYSGNSEKTVEVAPSASQEGTSFLIKAHVSARKEQQDMILTVRNDNYSEDIFLYDDGQHLDGRAGDGVFGAFFDSTNKTPGRYEVADGRDTLAFLTTYAQECGMEDNHFNRINIIVLSYGYNDNSAFENDAMVLLQSREDSIMNAEPFKSYAGQFSFSLIEPKQDLQCETGCRGISTLICCNNRVIAEEASRCSHDSVIVLLNSTGFCGSSSLAAKVCARNKEAGAILMHEMGHSFGGLADEYTYSAVFGNYTIGEINAPNCDIAGCQKWKGTSSGCYRGCTYSALYRSEEKNTIMYDSMPKFNLVSKMSISRLITGILKEKSSEKPIARSYFVNMNYNKGEIAIGDIYTKPIKAPINLINSIYTAEIKDINNRTLSATYLNVPAIILPIDNSSVPVIDSEFEFSAILPYSNYSNTLEIKRNNLTLATAILLPLSEMCGDALCSEGENHLSCQGDCGIMDDFCETSGCDPDCPSTKDCQKSQDIKKKAAMTIAVMAAFVIFFIIANYFRKK